MYSYYITPVQYEIAEENGISRQYVNDRVRIMGWEVERAINTPVRKYRNKQEKEILLKQLEVKKIKLPTYLTRIRMGMTHEEAISTPTMTQKERVELAIKSRYWENTVITTEQYKVAAENGICKRTAYARVVRYGWSVEKAITVTPDYSKSRTNRAKRIVKQKGYKNGVTT